MKCVSTSVFVPSLGFGPVLRVVNVCHLCAGPVSVRCLFVCSFCLFDLTFVVSSWVVALCVRSPLSCRLFVSLSRLFVLFACRRVKVAVIAVTLLSSGVRVSFVCVLGAIVCSRLGLACPCGVLRSGGVHPDESYL